MVDYPKMPIDSAGNWISSNSTSSIMPANGKAPRNTSFSDTVGSFKLALITKQEMPNGGVSNPISAPMTVTMPNHTRLIPIDSTRVMKSGTTTRMIDAVSRIVPRNSINTT